jgi:hypothetical protein
VAVEAQQVSVKIYAADAAGLEPDDFVRAFHRWIQDRRLDETMIDVVDYSHVEDGPGVLLVCHDAHYSMERSDGKLGLVYASKRDEPGPLADKLRAALVAALRACRLLEDTDSVAGRLRFSGRELVVRVASRIVAPNAEPTYRAAAPVIAAVGREVFGAEPELSWLDRDPRALFGVRVVAPAGVATDPAALLGHLAPH